MKNRIKPVYLMHQERLPSLEKKAVLDGALELIKLSKKRMDLFDLGVFKSENFLDINGYLNEYQSVDWYIEKGRETGRGNQLNVDTMQFLLCFEPWRKNQGEDHYDIFVVNEDMFSQGTNFVIGLAQEGIGTTISTYRFKELDKKTKYECIKTETMHELGHAFGLPPSERTKNVENSLGLHCKNKCIMRQGLTLPKDWIKISKDRIKHGALCSTCEKNLVNYFR